VYVERCRIKLIGRRYNICLKAGEDAWFDVHYKATKFKVLVLSNDTWSLRMW